MSDARYMNDTTKLGGGIVPLVERSEHLRGTVRLTSIEGTRPAESKRPSPSELKKLQSSLEKAIKRDQTM